MDSNIAKVIGRLIADYDYAYIRARNGEDWEKRHEAFEKWHNVILLRDHIYDVLGASEKGTFFITCQDALRERLAELTAAAV